MPVVIGQFYAPLIDLGSSGATTTVDWDYGIEQYVTLTGNSALTFLNPKNGARYVLVLASGAGGFTPSFPANWQWLTGLPVFTTVGGKYHVVTALYLKTPDIYLAASAHT